MKKPNLESIREKLRLSLELYENAVEQAKNINEFREEFDLDQRQMVKDKIKAMIKYFKE